MSDTKDANDTNNSAALQIKTYRRRPMTVEAVQVTESNMEAVAEWCGGRVDPNPPFEPAVRIFKTESALIETAYLDNWITRNEDGEHYVYYEDDFAFAFEEVTADGGTMRDPEKLEGLLEAVRDYVNRQPAERPDRDDYDMSKDGWKYGSDLEAWLTAQSLKPALAAFEGDDK